MAAFRLGWPTERARLHGAFVISAVLVLTTVAMAWISYRAVREWERSTRLSLERRADEVLALLAVALNRDMKGAQLSVLVPINGQNFLVDQPYDLSDLVARAFARFPYPESFFAWQENGGPDGVTYFFNRSERPPPWDTAPRSSEPYPVVIVRDPAPMRALVEYARDRSRYGRRFVLFESKIGTTTYQTVVHLLYGRPDDHRAFGLVGFTVNLDWVRREYFAEMLRQVQGIGGPEGGLTLSVIDDTGREVATTGGSAGGGPSRERPFSLLFFEQSLVSALPPGAPPLRRWRARVSAAGDSTLTAASLGAGRSFIVIAFAAATTAASLVLILRAIRTATELAVMKSEFVSAVTHELKTPVAFVRLVGDTLAKGRYTSASTIADYARLLSNEATQLMRLVDNLLTFARLSDLRTAYTFDFLHLADIVEDALDRFRPQLAESALDVTVQMPAELPHVKGDRTMLVQAFDNLIDNAIKYGGDGGGVSISGNVLGRFVQVEIADRGPGIPADELPKVFEKFFRGRNVRKGGSGLGLAIARRVIRDHGGELKILSVNGSGTKAVVALPLSKSS